MQRLEAGENRAPLKMPRRSVWQECRERAQGEGERHTEAMSQRASRNLTGAAKELAFLPQAMGTHWRTGSNRKGLGTEEGSQLPPLLVGHS